MLGARADLASFLTVRAGRARSGRLPTLFELFGTNGDVRPNPDLAPEEATTWDAGFRLRPPAGARVSGFLDVSLYWARRDSLIVFIQNSQQSFKAVNLESAVAEGLEAQWEVRWGRARLDGSFTTQDVRQHGEVPHWENRWVPYVSPREIFLRAGLRAGPADLRVEYDFMDRFYRDRANTDEGRAPSRKVVSAGARVRLPGGPVTLDLDLQNIGDVRSEDAYGYPMPGRTLYATLAYGVGGEKE
jgi:iron complex outermembrane receptor protein